MSTYDEMLRRAKKIAEDTDLPVAVLRLPDGTYRCEMQDGQGTVSILLGEMVVHLYYPTAIPRFSGIIHFAFKHQYPTDAYEAICGGVCPVCGGDCFEANPPVTNCPMRRDMGIRK